MQAPSAPAPPDPAKTASAQTANNIGTAVANSVLGNVNQVTPYGSLTYYRTDAPQGAQPAPPSPAGTYANSGSGGSGGTGNPDDLQVNVGQNGTYLNEADGVVRNTPEGTPYAGGQVPRVQFGAGSGGSTGVDMFRRQPSDPARAAYSRTAAPTGYSAAGAQAPDGMTTGGLTWVDPNSKNGNKVYNIPQYTAVQEFSPEMQAIFDQQVRAQTNMAGMAADQSERISEHLSQSIDPSVFPQGGSADNLQYTPGERIQQSATASGQIAGAGNVKSGYAAGGGIQRGVSGERVQRSVGGQQFDGTIDDSGRINQSLGDGTRGIQGNIQARDYNQSLGNAGRITDRVGGVGNVQRDFADNSNRITTGVDGVQLGDTFGAKGNIERNLRTQNVQNGVSMGGRLTKSYNTDFSEDRQRVEEALMSRMNPQLGRDKEALRTQLLNQGVREGSEAFDRAMNRFNEQANDARMQAILAGGQEQSRLVGLESQRAAFENSVVGQRFGQGLAAGQFRNNAAAQRFAQDAEAAAFNNSAQQQAFDQGLQRQTFQNDARLAEQDAAIRAGTFQNQALGQQFAQRQQNAAFGNAAQAQAFSQGAQSAALNNSAQAQRFGQGLQAAQFGADQQARGFQDQLAAGQFNNAAAGQRFDQQERAAGFNNAAQAQQFAQNAAQMNATNAAAQMQQNSDLARGQFANAAAAQAFDQNMQQGAFRNNAQAQANAQSQQAAQFANAAQAQRFGQNAAQTQMANSALAQNNAAVAAQAGFNNAAGQQDFAQQAAIQGRRDADRSVAMQEAFALRNQPLNEIGALLGTGQVTQPNFVNTNMPSIPTTDRAGLEMDAYNQQLAAWQANTAQRNSLMGGVLGTVGNIAGGGILMSDRRLKEDVVQIGDYGRLPVYRYRYKGEAGDRVGFMAQDVQAIAPEAIVWGPGGYAAVDYGKAMEAA